MRVMDVPEFQDARDLAAVNEGLTVRDAAILMAGRNVGAVIVLRDGCMSGIFTERDLMTKVAAQGLDCGTTLVRDVMTPRENLDTVRTDTSVAELLDRMFVDRHTGYPVMRNGRLVGVVTLDDARSITEVERDAYRVEDVMSGELSTISPDADAMTGLQRMQEGKVGRLPVVDDRGEVVGLISRSDLVTAFNIIQSRGAVPSLSIGDASDLPNPR